MHGDGTQPQPQTGNGQPTNNLREQIRTDADRIQELRERLYARGSGPSADIRHTIPQETAHSTPGRIDEEPVRPPVKEPADTPRIVRGTVAPGAVPYSDTPMGISATRRSFRKKLAIFGGIFFVIALVVSSFLLFLGNNTISGENISLTVAGPLSVGGGEELSFQVSVANQNAVPIQSATLIIEYPRGTHSATESDKEISIERKQLDVIDTGELVNVPLKARIFGEENEEQEIKVSIDYRVQGSNATFHKEAEPLRFKVSTSPVVMTFDSVKTISSGQEVEIKLTVQSNSPTPLSDILVKTSYPDGFDFTESEPDTVSGEDTWKITELKPAEKEVITIRGLITGYEDETRRFTATAGVANGNDRNTIASILANAESELSIEQPFLDVDVAINGSLTNTVVINKDETASIEIIYKNTLDTAIYDGKVLAELSGNALDEFEVRAFRGFYDSTKNTVTWDGVDEDSLKEILPGRSSGVTFTLEPKENIGQAPEMNIKVTVKGQRVFEDRVPQELIGTAERTIKVESVPQLTGTVLHDTGPFTNTGPTPPVAERVTQYTYMLNVKTSTNDVTGAEVTAVVPQYVTWLDLVTSGDNVTYNPSTRTLRWIIGDMDANSEEEVGIQVSFLPSLSQVGTTPTLLEAQRFKATDRFTGTVVRSEHSALTTSMFDESSDSFTDGKVQAD